MKRLKKITLILVIVLISMIAFGGIYTHVQNRMENQVKNYEYTMDIKGARNVKLTINKENKTIVKDKEGKQVEDADNLTEDEIKEKEYTKEEKPYNEESVFTVENYQKSKEIIEKRLKEIGTEQFNVRVNEETGEIVIDLVENENTDTIVSNAFEGGKFEIIDTQTQEVLMNNSDIRTANVMYGSSSQSALSQGTNVYLQIEFNEQGKKKLENISSQYVKVEEEDTTSDETTEDNTIEEEEKEDKEEQEETKAEEKTITMKIDDEEIMTTSFEEPIKTGIIPLSVGSATTDTRNFTK